MRKWLLLIVLLAIIPIAVHAQGALLVVTKQSAAKIDAGREPDGLAWWAR